MRRISLASAATLLYIMLRKAIDAFQTGTHAPVERRTLTGTAAMFRSKSLLSGSPLAMTVAALAAMSLAACGGSEREAAPAPEPAPVPTPEITDVSEPVTPDADVEQDDHDNHDEHGDEHRSGEAHVHGNGEIAVVLEDDLLTIALVSPMYNIIGFERAPENAEEEAALAEVRALLADGPALFVLDASAGCTFEGADLTFSDEHAHGSGDGESADEHADHDDHGEDDEGYPPEAPNGGEGYRDLDAAWTWTCTNPDALGSVEARLFTLFERFETIEAIIYRGEAARAETLSPSNTSIELPD